MIDDDDDDGGPKFNSRFYNQKNLQDTFVNYLMKNDAINTDNKILKQINTYEADVEKVCILGVDQSIYKDLESKFRVISTPSRYCAS